MQYLIKLLAIGQAALLISLSPGSLFAAMPKQGYYPPEQQNTTALKEMRDSLETMKHTIRNQETEIRTFEERLESLDSIIDSLRDQLSDTSKSHKEQLKGNTTSLESKLTGVETSIKGILADLKQFQAYSTEASATLLVYQKKITDMEKAIALQNQNMDDMQAAIKSMADLLQIKSGGTTKTVTSSDGGYQTYTIRDGDSLDKIARANLTTIKVIKELNGLTSDRIVVGKQLKLPSP